MGALIEIRGDFMNSTGAKIKKLRTEAKLSQAQFAEKIGCTTKSVQRYESGKCYPETYTLIKIAKLFGVPTDFLLASDTVNILDGMNRKTVYIVYITSCIHNAKIIIVLTRTLNIIGSTWTMMVPLEGKANGWTGRIRTGELKSDSFGLLRPKKPLTYVLTHLDSLW